MEKLLEDIKPSEYHALIEHIGALQCYKPSDSFYYKSGVVSFHGRNNELNQLKDFCSNETDKIKWWAITGHGGTGKNRLVYEFAQQMKHFNWNTVWLNSSNIENLISQHISVKTIIVVDYAQAYIHALGSWVEHLVEQERSLPVRILLIERDGNNLEDCSWGSALKRTAHRDILIRQTCWKKQFLILSSLSDNDLIEIMKEYAGSMNRELELKEVNKLLETLKIIDPELHRPLYAMFITDALVHGKKLQQWGQEKILQYVVERENDYFTEKSKELFGNNVRLYTLLNEIRIVSTIWGEISKEQIQKEYPYIWNRIRQQANTIDCVKSEMDLLQQVGLLYKNVIIGIKPDLIGEYFILKHIIDYQYEKLIFHNNWEMNIEILVFLHRIYLDFHDKLENIENFLNNIILNNSSKLMDPNRYIYSSLLVNITAFSKIYVAQATNALMCMWIDGNRQEIDAISYAQGLFNMLNKQNSEEKAKDIIYKLESLYRQYKNKIDIVLVYAQGLINLSHIQNIYEAKCTINKLESLCNQYSNKIDIILVYAQGLVSLSHRQNIRETKDTINKLKNLHRQYCDNIDIANEYAKGLVNLSHKQNNYEAKNTITMLNELCRQYPDNINITHEFVKGLFNLSNKQDIEESKNTICKIGELCHYYQYNIKIALVYAQGLVNLSAKKIGKQTNDTIQKLETLWLKYYNNPNITILYAKGLLNMSAEQNSKEIKNTIYKIEKLYQQYEGNLDIALVYAQALLNMSAKQDSREINDTICKIEGLHQQYERNLDIALVYVQALLNMSVEQNSEEAKNTIRKIGELCQHYGKNSDIALVYAQGFSNLYDEKG